MRLKARESVISYRRFQRKVPVAGPAPRDALARRTEGVKCDANLKDPQ